MACLKIPKFEPTEQKLKIFFGNLIEVEVDFNNWRSRNNIKIDKIENSSHSGFYVLTILYTRVIETKDPQDTDYDLYNRTIVGKGV